MGELCVHCSSVRFFTWLLKVAEGSPSVAARAPARWLAPPPKQAGVPRALLRETSHARTTRLSVMAFVALPLISSALCRRTQRACAPLRPSNFPRV